MQQFAKRLYQLMDEKGVSRSALGNAVGVTRQSIAQYLDGNTQPNAEKLCAIADFFNVSADYLLGRTDCRSSDIDMQEICKKTGLWPEAVERLLALKKSERKAIIGDDDEGLMDSVEIPQWEYDVFSVCINLFLLDDFSPGLAREAYHVVEEDKKIKETSIEIVDKARAAVADIDPGLWVLDPVESRVFYKYRVDYYFKRISGHIIDGMKEWLELKEGR